jgi:hypothetical protein
MKKGSSSIKFTTGKRVYGIGNQRYLTHIILFYPGISLPLSVWTYKTTQQGSTEFLLVMMRIGRTARTSHRSV